jgi:hypothetical protein
VVLVEWFIVLVLHCSCTVVAYPHVLQAWSALPDHTSCRLMMALTLGGLETCVCALGTCGPSHTGRPARLFSIFEARSPQGIIGRAVAALKP